MWRNYLVRLGIRILLSYYERYLMTIGNEDRATHASLVDGFISWASKKRNRRLQIIVAELQDWDNEIHGDF